MQDRALELSQVFTRLQPEFVSQPLPRPPIRVESVGLPIAAVEREHEVSPEPFAQGLLLDESLQLRDDVAMPPEVEVGLDPLLEADEP